LRRRLAKLLHSWSSGASGALPRVTACAGRPLPRKSLKSLPYQSSRLRYRNVIVLTNPPSYFVSAHQALPVSHIGRLFAGATWRGRLSPPRRRSRDSNAQQPCSRGPGRNHCHHGMHGIALNRELGVGCADTYTLPVHRSRVCTSMESALAHGT
jgi:hypothetical protein